MIVLPASASKKEIIQHCFFHSIMSATPSFIFAICVGWSYASQIFGMLVGIGVFCYVAALAHVSKIGRRFATTPYFGFAVSIIKSIRLIQIVLIGFSTLMLSSSAPPPRDFSDGAIFLMLLDLYAGILANLGVKYLGLEAVIPFGPTSVPVTEPRVFEFFLQAFLATFVEGLILSAALLILAVALWLILRIFKLLKSQ